MEFVIQEDRIVAMVDETEVGYITFEGNCFTHTFIYEQYRGLGYAEKLVKFAVEYLEKQGEVQATCWYVKDYLERRKKMSQYERMIAGLIYDPGDKEIMSMQSPYLDKLKKFNELNASDALGKNAYMKEVFASCGEHVYIELPLHANWGGAHLSVGNHFYANFNLTLVDDGNIIIGDNVMIGPNVTICTANHPIEPSLRAKGLQYNKDVHIGNNVWIGANVMIVPGITVGDNSVIGAGSVVTKDIPANVVAVGNPCRVLREIGERDHTYFYKDEKIDWENL